MKTDNLSILKINKLTQEQYDAALADGRLNSNELYLTPEEPIDLSPYTTKEELETAKSGINSALAEKQNTITGAATTITDSNLTANRALISDNAGKVAVSAITSTELSYLDNVTSNIQTQLNGKLSTTGTAADSNKLGGLAAADYATASAVDAKFANLDGTVTGTGNFVKTISQTDGKITATRGGIAKDDIPNHADSTNKFGSGDSTNFGHLKLSDSTSSSSNVSGGIAATPKAVKAAYDLASTAKSAADDAKNQNAISSIIVGENEYHAPNTTSSLELIGNNVSINATGSGKTGDITITLGVANGSTSAKGLLQLTDGVTSSSTTTAATPNAVKQAYDKASTNASAITGINSSISTINGDANKEGSIAYAVAAEATIRANADNALDTRVTTLETAVGTGGSVETKISNAVKAEADLRSAADSAIETAYKNADTQIRADFAAADTATLNSAKSDAATKASNALKDAKAYADGLKTTIDTNYKAADSAIEAAYKKADSDIITAYKAADTTTLNSAKSDATTKANTAETNAKAYADGLKTTIDTNYKAADTNLQAQIDTLNAKTEDSDGDTGKSVRVIAQEETAKIVNNAPAAYDTLKEIADWIGNDSTGAAGMASNLLDVRKEVYGTTDGKVASDGKSRIDINADDIDSINSKITAMKVTDTAVAKQLVSEVDQTDGKITVKRRALVAADIPSHKSTATTYGVGDNDEYGHVMLSDSYASDFDNSKGTAATPKAVKAAYDLADTAKTATDDLKANKLNKLTYEWNKEYTAGGTAGYLLIGSFPMYDTNITIDIDATTTTTYHGTVVIATQNVSDTSIGSAHTITVYGDPTGAISNAISVTWVSGSRNYNIYFAPSAYSKNLIHIRALGSYLENIDETTICTFTAGTLPTITSGLTVVNALISKFDEKLDKTATAADSNKLGGVAAADYATTASVTAKIAALDGTVTGTGNFVKTISQTDGKITATRGNIAASDIPAHAVDANTYGLGTNGVYGHVKLSDSVTSTSGQTSGIAATPAAVKSVKDNLDTLDGEVDSLTAQVEKVNVAYGTCATDAATAAKVVTVSNNTNWKLAAGSLVTVVFSSTNTAENPTLNVNGTGAKNIFYGTSQITDSGLSYAGHSSRPIVYMYDGTQYRFISWGYESGNTNTQVRTYLRGDSGYDKDYPLIASQTVKSSIGTAEDKYASVYGLVPTNNNFAPTINPHTGEVKAYDLTLGNSLEVTGGTVLNSTLNAKGAVDFDSTLNVDGSATLKATSATTLSTSGKATLNSLEVSGASALKGAVTASSTLSTSGKATLNSLEVTNASALKGAVTASSTLNVTGKITGSGALEITGNADLNGGLDVGGVTTHTSGHIYLTGSQAASSTGNTTQLVFGTEQTPHIALSANDNALVINPTTSSTDKQIVLWLNKASKFPSGIEADITGDLTGTASNATADASGNTITSTYETKSDASNKLTEAKAYTDAEAAKKQNTITGAATTITGSNLTASRALISNSSGKVAVSAVTSTELGYLDGVTSAIQTQLNGKLSTGGGTISGNLTVTGKTTTATAEVTTGFTSSGSATFSGTAVFNKDYGVQIGNGVKLTYNETKQCLNFTFV